MGVGHTLGQSDKCIAGYVGRTVKADFRDDPKRGKAHFIKLATVARMRNVRNVGLRLERIGRYIL